MHKSLWKQTDTDVTCPASLLGSQHVKHLVNHTDNYLIHYMATSLCFAHRLQHFLPPPHQTLLQMPPPHRSLTHAHKAVTVCHRQALSSKLAQASVPADVCRAALQGVQGALLCVSPTRQAALLAAVTSLSSRAAARSAVKAACLEFQLALLAKGGAVLHPDPGTGVPQLPEAVLVQWLQVSRLVC